MYFASVIVSNAASLKEDDSTVISVLSGYMTELTTRYIPYWGMAVMTVIIFGVILAICYLSKLVLNKYTLMEMLHSD